VSGIRNAVMSRHPTSIDHYADAGLVDMTRPTE
jgi:hypothetical protein